MLRLNCFFKANDGKTEEALSAAKALVAESLNDEGCVAYDVFQSATRPDVLLICETWDNDRALAKHSVSSHFKKYVGELEKLGQMKIEKFNF